MPRYVVLQHDSPFLHWDFMLEIGEALRTWRLMRRPARGDEIAAQAMPNHRIAYLDYVGPVSGNRGHVTRWDDGRYETIDESVSRIEVALAGEKLRGRAILLQPKAGGQWRFQFLPA